MHCKITMVTLTMVTLTMVTLTMVTLTMVTLTMVTLTMVTLTMVMVTLYNRYMERSNGREDSVDVYATGRVLNYGLVIERGE